jgi:hypothetical protein
MVYRAKHNHLAVYQHGLTKPEAEPYPVDHWRLAGLSLVVISAGSVVGLILIAVAKLLEGR